jgi:hypothetical protein
MIYKSQISAENIRIPEAEAFRQKLARLGIVAGEVHLNGVSAGAEVADIVPASSQETNEAEAYNCLIWIGREWRNVAMLRRMLGSETVSEFRSLATECGLNPDSAILGIPGAAKAIEKLLRAA